MLLVLWLIACCTLAFATPRALLVGVSELANQPQALWLQAPRNDVMLMRDALLKQGFAASDIAMLADGVNGAALPESQAIHEALAKLLAQSRSGDFVLLYFSGHGTRLRDIAKRYQEPDGLSENFLARDVRGTLGSDNVLTGDLRDADFDAWIQSFLAKNVFVASVFDTCSANSMTR
ncbi:caspase family protein, partial [Variovorax sp. Varisp62]|uniref:caspase family protein n=1 Tax=Variovorax sp. Varisp62 TaxID=3243049 RepID=UPI0039B43430